MSYASWWGGLPPLRLMFNASWWQGLLTLANFMHEDPSASHPLYWHTDANYSPKRLDSCHHPELFCYILTNEIIKITRHGLNKEVCLPVCLHMNYDYEIGTQVFIHLNYCPDHFQGKTLTWYLFSALARRTKSVVSKYGIHFFLNDNFAEIVQAEFHLYRPISYMI